MRLRQLARKLGVQPDKIVTLLAENGHALENEANSKLTAEQEALALAHWPPETEDEPETEAEEVALMAEAQPEKETLSETSVEVDTAIPDTIEPVAVTVDPVAEEEPTKPEQAEDSEEQTEEETAHEVPFGPPSHATSQVSENTTEDSPVISQLPDKIELKPETNLYPAYEEDESYAEAELIKTETPQLEGLKVVGKIDLPEPKKPEPKSEDEEAEATDKPEKVQKGRDRNKRGRERKGRNSKPRLSTIEYERQKAEKIAKRKKEKEAEKLRQKKREHYLANVKHKKPSTEPNRKKKEQEEEIAPLPIIGQSRPKPKAAQKPKGPKQKKGLKKFWAWLNGEYDKY